MTRAALAFLVSTLVIAGVFLAIVFSGGFSVAATQPDARLLRWALSTAAERSIARHAGVVGPMPSLDSATLAHGLDHFHAMCVDCHGAPGFDRSEAGEGLYPEAPDLAEVVEEGEWSDGELFWIVKNGIKMTGMPAFGPTHSDADIWSMVALVKELPDLSEAAYAERLAELRSAFSTADDDGGAGPTGTHVHADGMEHVHE